ncbi:homoserine kinase [Fredinandcohnia quinoae]|uniref:Homoserine kinase n=1 Tax=Fredinandcohnia quinoae TaxID=2918902 RepID=A0AAW5E3Z7_9BACI|nr:homoserine kinase [Fredinandcohnia sp. SECRCQ15]MCH1625534.1 homoserine kinase [Fredinandcohnia sp. SECRCQ15]
MKSKRSLQITVPGSTANLGPGFDSLGLAVSRYLTLHVEPSDKWEFIPISPILNDIPTGQENLVYVVASQIARAFSKDLPPMRVNVSSDIPLARGLGSSAAAIVAAIELTNEICDLQLTDDEKLQLACQYEGHPDNVGASLFGGLVIGSHRGSENTDLIRVNTNSFEMVVLIPSYELKTTDARKVLPEQLSHQDAVKASAISNVLVAALLTNNIKMIGKMMDLDLLHQPYRTSLIREFEKIREAAKRQGAFGVAISGAGPTVICFVENGKGKEVKASLMSEFEDFLVEEISIETKGSTISRFDLQD